MFSLYFFIVFAFPVFSSHGVELPSLLYFSFLRMYFLFFWFYFIKIQFFFFLLVFCSCCIFIDWLIDQMKSNNLLFFMILDYISNIILRFIFAAFWSHRAKSFYNHFTLCHLPSAKKGKKKRKRKKEKRHDIDLFISKYR